MVDCGIAGIDVFILELSAILVTFDKADSPEPTLVILAASALSAIFNNTCLVFGNSMLFAIVRKAVISLALTAEFKSFNIFGSRFK